MKNSDKRASSTETRRKQALTANHESLTDVLATFRRPDTLGFQDAWVGMEPTFSSRKAVRRWLSLAETPAGEERFFEDEFMQSTAKSIARAIVKQYRGRCKKRDEACFFADVDVEADVDPWLVRRQAIRFQWKDRELPPFEVRFGLDPETFEFSIKPVPAVWFYDERFVRFLERFVWGVPEEHGLVPSMAHGGGQFSFSAKTFLQGSLLADDIAHRVDHPELSTWILDYPNADDRAFRATKRRRAAFEKILREYWSGAFHPRATGAPTVESAYLDRGFEPAPHPPAGLVDPRLGPVGDPREVFQANFAFGRAVRNRAQNVEPGYWQSAHPGEDGYRPDQIMRYSEGNLNRLQIAGEWHVKSGKALDPDDIRELDAPLEPAMLYDEASWEHRAQMSRTSACNFVEAVLLELHHARWLAENPHVTLRGSLAQDQLLGDAAEVLARRAPKRFDKLRRRARAANLAASRGRIHSDRVEPEALYWAAWRELTPVEKAAIAHEAILGFVERVENAATMDPRPETRGDPLERHRHRIHPLLWRALEEQPGALDREGAVRREWKAWKSRAKDYVARRPIWSPLGTKPPWKRGGSAST